MVAGTRTGELIAVIGPQGPERASLVRALSRALPGADIAACESAEGIGDCAHRMVLLPHRGSALACGGILPG